MTFANPTMKTLSQRPVHKLASAHDQVVAISYDERTDWHAGAICEVNLKLHFTRAMVLHCICEIKRIYEKWLFITQSKVFRVNKAAVLKRGSADPLGYLKALLGSPKP